MLKLDVLAAELNLWANETEQIYRATKESKYRGDAKHLRYLAATLNQSSLPSTGVTSFNTRVGDVVLSSLDVTTALGYNPVTQARTLTINGVTYDLSADRSWTISTAIPTLAQVTTAGNTTTNAINISQLTVTALSDYYTSVKFNSFSDTNYNLISFYLMDHTTSTVVLGRNGASVAYPYKSGMRASYGFVGNNFSGFHIFAGSNISQTIHTNGNIGIGTTTDAGYKLDVNGTARIQGNTILLGTLNMGNGSFSYSANPNDQFTITGNQGLILNHGNGNSVGAGGNIILGSSTSPNFTVSLSNIVRNGVAISRPVTPISGSSNVEFNSLLIDNSINYTNATSSIARGLYIAPTLTSVSNFRAIETTSGDVILNTQSASVNAGYTTVAVGGSSGVYFQMYVGPSPTSQNLRGQLWAVGNNLLLNNPAAGYLGLFTTLYSGITIWPTTGNVYVGASPSTDTGYKLDVAGTARVQSSFTGAVLKIDGTGAATGFEINSQLDNDLRPSYIVFSRGGTQKYIVGHSYGRSGFFISNGNDTVTYLNINSAGNVLVGTTTDGNAKFVVAGSITAASAIARGVYFNNTLVAAANNDVLVGLDINPTFTNGAFTGVGNIGLRVSGQVLFNAYGAYNTVTPTLRIENVDTNNVAIQIKGNVANYKYYWIYDSQTTEGIYKSDQARIDFYGGTNVGFAFRNNYGRLFTIVGSTGNVLIGTTTDAGYKLDVNGTGRFVNTLNLDSNLTFGANNIVINSTAVFGRLSIYGTASASAAIAIGYTSTASNNSSVSIGYNSQNSGDRAVTIGADTSSNATNSVTIGRGSVGTTDSFVSGSNLGTIADVYFGSGVRHASANTAGADYRINGSGASNNFNIAGGNIIIAGGKGTGTGTPGDVIFATSSLLGSTLTLQSLTNRVWIKGDSGNVGIGTSTPTDKLQVAGNVRFGTGAVGTLFFWDNVNGRLGIGNTTPSYKLEVNGGAFFNENIIIANGDGIKFWVDKVRIAPATIDSLGFYTGTTAGSPLEQMRIVSNGNVLIGTTTDNGNKLNVNGDVSAQAYKVNNVLGFTGIFNVPTNPPGQQNLDIQGGIVVNVF